MKYDSNSWDFIRYSFTVWGGYLSDAMDELYNKDIRYTYQKDQDSAILLQNAELLIDCMQSLAPKKTNNYAEWFKMMSGVETSKSLEDAEQGFLIELIAEIYDVAWDIEKDSFLKSLLREEALPKEDTHASSESIAKAIVDVVVTKKDLSELVIRLTDFIQMDILTRSRSMRAVAYSMQMDGGKVQRLRNVFGFPKLSLGAMGSFIFKHYSVFFPISYRKKKNRLLLLCLVYLRNSYSLVAAASTFTIAVKELLRQNGDEERIAAALAYFEQVYDAFNSEKLLPISQDSKSLIYQIFHALKEKYSFNLLYSELMPPSEERLEVAKFLLEQINHEEEFEYENANEILWKEIENWIIGHGSGEVHPKVLLVDYCFPFIRINEYFTIEKKDGVSWGKISDELTRQYIDMLGYIDIYGDLNAEDRFDFILLRKPDQDIQRQYHRYLAPHGKYLYSMAPDKTIAKEEVKNEIGNLIHRMGTFLTMSDQAVSELKNTICRPGKEQQHGVSLDEAAKPLYTVLDVFDYITSSIRLKNVTILGGAPKLKKEMMQTLITDYYESRSNLFGNRFELVLTNTIPETTMVLVDKPDFFAILDELLKNSLKYAFDGIAPKNRRVLIYSKRVLYHDSKYALISVGDNGIGCAMNENDYFQIGKTSGGTGQGGDDIYSTVKSFGGYCHLRSKEELAESFQFMMDILLPVVEDDTKDCTSETYNYTTFEKL